MEPPIALGSQPPGRHVATPGAPETTAALAMPRAGLAADVNADQVLRVQPHV